MFIFQTKQKSVHLPNQTKINLIKPHLTQPHQTKLIHTKPNSSTTNQTHPYQTELNLTKPNSSIPNQTKLDDSQPNLTNPNWLSMHSRTISSSCLLLAHTTQLKHYYPGLHKRVLLQAGSDLVLTFVSYSGWPTHLTMSCVCSCHFTKL